MSLSNEKIKEFNKLILELEKTGWEIIGAYWMHYAQTNIPSEYQNKLNIITIGFSDRNSCYYRQSLSNAIRKLKLIAISADDITMADDIEFHSGIFHLDEKREHTLLKNVFFNRIFLTELYIFRCIENESIKKYPPRKKIILFKYFKNKQFKDDFLKGKVWTGTLSGFRKIENDNQGDKSEGLTFYNTTQSFTEDTWKEVSINNPSIGGMVKFGDSSTGSLFTISNLTVSLPDSYTICFSTKRDDELFKDDFGEFCVKINDAEKLYFAISIPMLEMNPDIKRMNHNNVQYTKKELTNIADKIYTAFHKPERYFWQEEYRFSWTMPHTEIISPFLLDFSNLLSQEIMENIA